MTTTLVPSDPPRQTARTSSFEFSYTDEGQGPAVVLVHGLPGSGRDFRWLAAALAPSCRVVRLDLPGFGGTPASAAGLSIEARGRFVVQAVEALNLERCVVAGHSMGGPVAAQAAVLAPERFHGLGLLASVGVRPHVLMRRFAVMMPFASKVDWPVVGPLVARTVRVGFRAAGFPPQTTLGEVVQTIRVVARLDLETHRQNLKRLGQRTLVAWAEDDTFIERAIAEELASQVPQGPRLTWPKGGHNVQKSQAVPLAQALAQLAR